MRESNFCSGGLWKKTPTLSVDEIFDFVGRKLEIQDKQDFMRGFREVPFPKTTRFGRQVKARENQSNAEQF